MTKRQAISTEVFFGYDLLGETDLLIKILWVETEIILFIHLPEALYV